MGLCHVCQKLDIREILIKAYLLREDKASKLRQIPSPRPTPPTAEYSHFGGGAEAELIQKESDLYLKQLAFEAQGLVDEHNEPALFFAHHDSVFSLRKASIDGCDLCTVIWRSWMAHKDYRSIRSIEGEEALNAYLHETYSTGKVYIGAKVEMNSYRVVQEVPSVGVYVADEEGLQMPRKFCDLDLFVRRGDSN